jgi:hypothetical protein
VLIWTFSWGFLSQLSLCHRKSRMPGKPGATAWDYGSENTQSMRLVFSPDGCVFCPGVPWDIFSLEVVPFMYTPLLYL